MARKTKVTARSLARDSNSDIDEVLISLWDVGIDSVVGPDDVVPVEQVKTARAVVGLIDQRVLRTPRYWVDRLKLDDGTLDDVLDSLGIAMSPGARRLPKGAVSKLRSFERQRFGRQLEPELFQEGADEPDFDPVSWRTIGHKGEFARLTVDDVRVVHMILVKTFRNEADPISPPGERGEHLLPSAVFRQSTSIGNVEKYPTPEMSAAALMHSLVIDHPFFNGNKRTAVVSAACLLYENRLRLTCTEDELFKIVVDTAQRNLVDPRAPDLADREILKLSEWFSRNSRIIDRRSRVMTWLKLKRVLSAYDVAWDSANVGNRLNFRRSCTETSGLLKRAKTVHLHTQVAYSDDGRDVPRNVIAKIRADLHLDEKHGVDAGVFFEEKEQAEDIIVAYQGTLRRLARR